MKQNPNFLLQEVADSIILVPVGEAVGKFPGMITLNETGKILWDALCTDQTADSLVAALLEQFEVDATQARQDVDAFLYKLTAVGAITD